MIKLNGYSRFLLFKELARWEKEAELFSLIPCYKVLRETLCCGAFVL